MRRDSSGKRLLIVPHNRLYERRLELLVQLVNRELIKTRWQPNQNVSQVNVCIKKLVWIIPGS